METVAQLTNVSKRYKNLQVIEDVNLKITDREFLSLIGPNGCGKSTIIKILAGVIDKYSGKIIVPNKTAYVPQQNSLLPWMNVLDNLIFPGVINPDSYLNNKDKAKSLLQEFKLDQFAGYYPQQLSGGMQQKLSILRAVNTSPDLLLLDEPFSALDAITRRSMQSWLSQLADNNTFTVICVTHDIQEAIRLSDRVAVLSARPGTVLDVFDVKNNDATKLERKLEKLLL